MRVMLAGTLLGKGGIQSHLRWMSKGLSEEGIQVFVLSLGDAVPSDEDLKIISDLRDQGIRVELLSPYRGGRFTAGYAKLARLRYIVGLIKQYSPDVYIALGTGWNLFVPPLLSRVKMRRIFFEVMSGIPVNRLDTRWGVKWWFDEVIGQSQPVAQNFVEYFNWKKPVFVIPAMPEPLEVTAQLPSVTSHSVKKGQVKAAFFGRLAPHKQAFWLVQQWDALKDTLAELHIYGSGPEESRIREYIAAHNLEDRIKCFGRYPEGQAYVDLLRGYDLTLLPTIGAEGAPLVLLESMACGVPFVAYGAGGINDYGIDNPDVLIVPVESRRFVPAIRQMTQKLEQGDVDQERLQRTYLKRYSYAALKKQWIDYVCKR